MLEVTPLFSLSNPSSSSELLGSSINQRLYEIPAGAKGQRRKLAAVFSSPFMLAAGLIAKCTISLISTLKQTPRQAGEELFACTYILWHRILFWSGGGSTPSSPVSLSALLSSGVGANSGVCSSHTALLTHFCSVWGAAMIAGLSSCSTPRWCYLIIWGMAVDCVDLFTPTVFIFLLHHC